MRRAFGIALVLGMFLTPQVAPAAQAPTYCAPGQASEFVHGFASLKAAVGDPMGNPLECEHTEPSTGDAHQATTTGLSFYRKSTNTPTFTDGYHHWALIAEGLAYWTGSSIDPPGMIVPTPTPTPIPSTPTATDPLPTQLAPTAELLLATSRGVKSASEVRAELERAGYLGPWDGASMLAAYERAIATPTPRPTLIPTATATPVPTVDPALRARCVQFATVYTAEVLRYSTSGDGALALYEFTLDGCLTAAFERGGIGVGCWEFAARQYLQANLISSSGPPPMALWTGLYRNCAGL